MFSKKALAQSYIIEIIITSDRKESDNLIGKIVIAGIAWQSQHVINHEIAMSFHSSWWHGIPSLWDNANL